MIEPNEDATTTGDEIVWIEEESTAADISEMENVGGDDLNAVSVSTLTDNEGHKVIQATGQVVIIEELADDQMDKPSKILCDSPINPPISIPEHSNTSTSDKLQSLEGTTKSAEIAIKIQDIASSAENIMTNDNKNIVETNSVKMENQIQTTNNVDESINPNGTTRETTNIGENSKSSEVTTMLEATNTDNSKNLEAVEPVPEINGVFPPKTVRFAEEKQEDTDTEDAAQRRGSVVTDEDLQLDEIQAKMQRNTREALDLVDKLCELEDGGKKQPMERTSDEDGIPIRKNEADSAGWRAENVEQQEIGFSAISEESDELEAFGFRVRPDLMRRPVDCVVLPNRRLLVLDDELGLLVLSLETRQVVMSAKLGEMWRSPKCACFGKDYIWVLLDFNVNYPENAQKRQKGNGTSQPIDQKPKDAKIDGNDSTMEVNELEHTQKIKCDPTNSAIENGEKASKFEQFICRFSIEDLSLVDRIEAPKYLLEKVVVSTRMCFVSSTECLYLAANTPNFGFLYELSASKGKWTEVYNVRERNYADIHHFAVVGPVTELFLVERNRSYVQMISVYNSKVVHDRMIGLCERPDSLCVDELGNLFIFDRAASKVSHFSRVYFQKVCDVALVERAHCVISAHDGVLAVLSRNVRELKLYRYDPKAEIEVFG